MVSNADTEYLKKHVGTALALGMAEVLVMQPPDKVEALALFLLKYADSVDAAMQVCDCIRHVCE